MRKGRHRGKSLFCFMFGLASVFGVGEPGDPAEEDETEPGDVVDEGEAVDFKGDSAKERVPK